jgi:hypothetical protein
MVVCKIEIWPGGDKDKARPLGVMMIANDGTGDADRANYAVKLSHAGIYFGRKGSWKSGTVKGHLRRLSPYHLVARALAACGIR